MGTVKPRTLGAFVLLSRFVCPLPISLGIPARPRQGECEFRQAAVFDVFCAANGVGVCSIRLRTSAIEPSSRAGIDWRSTYQIGDEIVAVVLRTNT